MIKPRRMPSTPADFLALARRRWLWWLAPTLLVTLATAAAVRYLPKQYQSSVTILVDPQKIPEDLVRSTVSTDVAGQLQEIAEVVLSHQRLAAMIQHYRLYPGERGRGDDQDELVTRMRKDIAVKTIVSPDQTRNGVDGFTISYIGRTPAMTQQVAQGLAALFIRENIKARSRQALGTESFIDGEVQKAATVLDQEQQKLRALEAHYMGSLPQQEAANLQLISQTQFALESDAADVDRAQQERDYLLTLEHGGPGAAAANPLPQKLAITEAELAAAEKTYTADYPEVIRLRDQVAALKSQLRQQPAAPPPPVKVADAGQIHKQLHALDAEVAQRKQDEKGLAEHLRLLQARLESSPTVAAALANEKGAYAMAKENYDNLLLKQQKARMAAAMEQDAQGEEFRVVDPATLPSRPVWPDPLKVDPLGALGGLLLGGLLAFVVEVRDSVVRDEEDVFYYIGRAPWALIPELPGMKKQ